MGPLRFGVIGVGRLGLTLATVLQQRGFEIVHASSASASGRDSAAHALGVPVHEDPLLVADGVDCVILCVPDDALASVVQRLTERSASASPIRLRIVSTSAAGGIDALWPLFSAGHDTCVMHPVAHVADHDTARAALSGAGAAIGASDDVARTFAYALAHALELHPFDLDDDAWPLHAATCTAASSLVTLVMAMVEELAAEAGVQEGIARAAYFRLTERVLARASRIGAMPALAGPIIRGDAVALGRQVGAVRASSSPHRDTFEAMLHGCIRAAFAGGRLDMATAERLTVAAVEADGAG